MQKAITLTESQRVELAVLVILAIQQSKESGAKITKKRARILNQLFVKLDQPRN